LLIEEEFLLNWILAFLHTLKHDFRNIDPAEAQVILVEASDRVLTAYPPELSEKAKRSLERLGVTVRLQTMLAELTDQSVTLKTPSGVKELPARTVLWAAGVKASPLARLLSAGSGAELDRAGRVRVAADLSLPNHPEVFALGDMAHFAGEDGQPLPGVAHVAITQGKYVAKLIRARLENRTLADFRYCNPGSLATIGRSAAVAVIGGWKFSGFVAWLLWLFIHLMKIVSYRNRLLVLVQWAWSYFSYDKSARLITGEGAETKSK
jgi:NADH dehydrogenase